MRQKGLSVDEEHHCQDEAPDTPLTPKYTTAHHYVPVLLPWSGVFTPHPSTIADGTRHRGLQVFCHLVIKVIS